MRILSSSPTSNSRSGTMIETMVHSSDRHLDSAGTLNKLPRLSAAALVFLGPPGAGKGTQARHVATEYRTPHISTGDVFRDHIARKTAFGVQAADIMARGMLVPDDVVCGMLREHIHALGCPGCLVLDGFPRSLEQAHWLDRFLHMRLGESQTRDASVAIQINVARDQLLRRLTGRRSCPRCGRTYNLSLQPPVNSGICDYDGAKLVMRTDDSERVVCKRLMVYDQNSLPLTEYYRRNGRLLQIDGSGTEDTVRNAIALELESYSAV